MCHPGVIFPKFVSSWVLGGDSPTPCLKTGRCPPRRHTCSLSYHPPRYVPEPCSLLPCTRQEMSSSSSSPLCCLSILCLCPPATFQSWFVPLLSVKHPWLPNASVVQREHMHLVYVLLKWLLFCFVLFHLCLFLLICVPSKCKMRFASPGPSLHGCGADIGRKRTVFFYLLLQSCFVPSCSLFPPSSHSAFSFTPGCCSRDGACGDRTVLRARTAE